jgi:hypothetical protein
MPLHAEIRINDKPIQVVTVARMEEFKGPDYWHIYMVVTTNDKGEETSATFNHLYRNGAEECLRRALEALSNKRVGRGDRR